MTPGHPFWASTELKAAIAGCSSFIREATKIQQLMAPWQEVSLSHLVHQGWNRWKSHGMYPSWKSERHKLQKTSYAAWEGGWEAQLHPKIHQKWSKSAPISGWESNLYPSTHPPLRCAFQSPQEFFVGCQLVRTSSEWRCFPPEIFCSRRIPDKRHVFFHHDVDTVMQRSVVAEGMQSASTFW